MRERVTVYLETVEGPPQGALFVSQDGAISGSDWNGDIWLERPAKGLDHSYRATDSLEFLLSAICVMGELDPIAGILGSPRGLNMTRMRKSVAALLAAHMKQKGVRPHEYAN